MYRLTGRLEQSQLADLFRGERVEASESVVLKLFHLKTSDAGYAKVVAGIARQLQSVTHAGVARVLDVGMIDGHLAIVRQDTGKYTLGLALQRLSTREVMLPPAVALALAVELMDAVGAAHEAGVVHSALTPGNILLGVDGRISVADFGALTALQASPTLNKSFGARGRDSYRAPEQGAGDAATIAGDLYALGAITYELLTLHEASTGNANVSTRSDRLPPPSRLVRRLHSRIDPIIMRALENSPGRRHKTCAEFAEGVREFLSASGGMPGREDLKKFVSELFPNEVQVSASGPVPIDRSFELTDIAGIGAVEADPIEADERPPFSGGRVDDRTATSDGLPVFKGELPSPQGKPLEPAFEPTTLPDMPFPAKRAVSEWEAPPGVMAPVTTQSQSGPTPQAPAVDPLKGRVRVQEDFAEIPGQEKAPPRAQLPERIAKTLVTFAIPGQVFVDRRIGLAEAEKRARRTVRLSSLLGGLALFGTLAGTTYFWFKSQNDPKGMLISYLPDPIERELAPDNKPLPPKLKPLKLADFDKLHPEKAFDPDPPSVKKDPPPARKDPPAEKDPAPPPVVKKSSDCYDVTPRGKVGYLSIGASTSVRVEVDGKRVCVNATKVPLSVGSHKVKVTDIKSKQEDVSSVRIEAGKLVKITPVFRSR